MAVPDVIFREMTSKILKKKSGKAGNIHTAPTDIRVIYLTVAGGERVILSKFLDFSAFGRKSSKLEAHLSELTIDSVVHKL